MHLESTDGCDEDNGSRFESRHAALDIDEFFSTEVCSEASFCHDIVCIFEGQFSSQHTVTAMSDIGKWSAVDDGRSMLQGLHQIWMDGIFEDSCHGPSSHEVFGCDRLSLVVVPNNDAIKTFFEIKDIF